ncbi:MAG: ABC transporter ATP-binding protein [Chelatococcus sp.]|uniref:ABC transporter ATP-binding protein n=1 Tax=Chelatococcus sp. TaxID=1953771 RepID=UPI0025C29BA8|nr:ABC transporter ATP-binding protein [Chelatococcus sp.]MBX3539566.1 ABC transporter ATP-binding protein [Chelatococcus sp.]
MPVLQLESIVKRYGPVTALGPVDIEVHKGELLTLLGPSGCGKTTTLHIIAGLTQPTEGRLLLAGRDITRLAPPYRDIGLVFQNYALFPHRTIAENIAFGLRMRKVPKPDITRRVRTMLDVVGLPNVEDRYPHQLSGGQRQRVALARALVIEPPILLLDEPLSNLDALLRKRMRLELRDIQQRLGMTTVFVTHDQDEAFEMSDRVILMNAGCIEQVGSPEELYDAPSTRFAAEFIGEASLMEGEVAGIDGDQVMVAVDELHVAARAVRPGLKRGGRAVLMIRPERIELADPDTPGAIALKVAKRVFQGDRILFDLRTGQGQSLHCSAPNLERFRAIETGVPVHASLNECRAIPVEAPGNPA